MPAGGLAGLHRELVNGVLALGRADEIGIAAQRTSHPLPVAGSALAHAAQGLLVPVVEVAHELGEVAIELVGVVGGDDELAARLGVAGLLALGGLLAHQDLHALLVGRDGRVGAGAAQAQNHDVVLAVPGDVVGAGDFLGP